MASELSRRTGLQAGNTYLAALVAAALLVACGGGSGDGASSTAGGDDRRFALNADPEESRAGGAPESVYSEAGKLVRADPTIAGLGTDLFGDKVNLYNGALEFVQNDFSIPGHPTLPVGASRKFTAGTSSTPRGMFADWDLEIPRMQGVFSKRAGWVVQSATRGGEGLRCTNAHFEPPYVPDNFNSGALFSAAEYWNGNFLYIPGVGAQEILTRHSDTPAPSDGNSWPLTTKGQWAVRCGVNLQNGRGEGFIALSPDGTQYRFDWMTRRTHALLSKGYGQPTPRNELSPQATRGAQPNEGGSGARLPPDYLLSRDEVWILPTLATDRFGNTTRYVYEAALPMRLLTIESTDPSGIPRRITFEYTNPNFPTLITRATDGSRLWKYSYDDTGSHLRSVERPDLSAWSYQLDDLVGVGAVNMPGTADCDGFAEPDTRVYSGSLTHPSGARGTFKIAGTAHGRSHVDRNCQGTVPGVEFPLFPAYTNTHSIQSKRIEGPGLETLNWTFSYGPPNACFAPCNGVPDTKTVEVTDTRNILTRYTFGNRFQVNEGQLLSTEEGANGPTAMHITMRRYRAAPGDGALYPGVIGESPHPRTQGDLAYRHTPEDLRQVIRQGTRFTWQATAFDVFARPTSVSRYSSLGHARVENIQYFDLHTKWVLNQLLSITVPLGATETVPESHTYDPATGLRQTSSSFGRQTASFEYHTDGTLWRQKDPLLRVTEYNNYKRGLAQNVSYPNTTNESAEVSDSGQILSVTNAAGKTTSYSYDAMDRLASITPPAESNLNYNPTNFKFVRMLEPEFGLSAGHWRQTITTGTARKVKYFDALWRERLETNADTDNPAETSSFVETRYGLDGKVSFRSYPVREMPYVGASTVGWEFWHDALGREIHRRQATENEYANTFTTYDIASFKKTVSNPRNLRTTYEYQALDDPDTANILKITPPFPMGDVVTFTRDVFGKATSITRGDANANATRRYVYDIHQRLCKTLEPETGATVISYDTAGNVEWRASGLTLPSINSCDQAEVGNQRKISFSYDARNRLEDTSYGDGSPGVNRTYTADGLLKTITTPGSQWTLDYNNRRLMTSETLAIGRARYAFTYAINANGHMHSMTYPRGLTLTYGPNALGQPTEISGFISQIKHHPDGQVASYAAANGVNYSLTLNRRGLPLVLRHANVVEDLHTYDGNGNLKSVTDQQRTQRPLDMSYDELDQLREAHSYDRWGPGQFSYDALGNLKTSRVGNRSATHVYDPTSNRLAEIRLSDLSVSAPPTTIAIGYDANGNVTSRAGQAFTFDIGNRLVSATNVASYAYDGHGRRYMTQTAGGRTTLRAYDQSGRLLTTQDSTMGFTQHIHLANKVVAEVNSSTGTRWLHTDILGSPVATTGPSGKIIERTDYEPYGRTVAGVNPDGIGFTGHVNDVDTGLVYMQQRYYDPTAGTFLSVDPITTDTNTARAFGRYHYAENNPYRYTDPDGQEPNDFLTGCSFANSCEMIIGGGAGGGSVLDRPSSAHTASPGCTNPTVACSKANTHFNTEYAAREKQQALQHFGPEAMQAALIVMPQMRLGLMAAEGVRAGTFSLVNWARYPLWAPKPVGTMRILSGAEYDAARSAANAANAALRRANPNAYAGKQIHEILPVKFGGSPTDPANKISLTQSQHAELTTFWNQLLRNVK